jgi:hypothetical protein
VLTSALAVSLLLAAPDPGAELHAGIASFHAFDDVAAAALLRQALADRPTPEQAAQAHLYLGLIAFNALRSKEASLEFERALQASPYAELPDDTSPKAKLLLVQVRQAMLGGETAASVPPPPAAEPAASAPAPVAAARPAPPEATASAEAPAGSHLTRWPAWTAAAAAVALFGTGIGFGIAQGQALSDAKLTSTGGAQAMSDGQAYARDGLVADVLFGVGAAAGVAAVVLFLWPAHGDGGASVAAGPAALRVSW